MSSSESISGPAVGPYPLVPLPPSDVSTAPLHADPSETDTTTLVKRVYGASMRTCAFTRTFVFNTHRAATR